MAFFKVKVDGRIYELERLTLADGVVLKKRFGLTDLETFSLTDPEAILGLLTLAIAKADGLTVSEAEKIAGDISWDDFEPDDTPEDEPEAESDPTPAGDDASEATGDPSSSGSSGKPRKKRGPQN